MKTWLRPLIGLTLALAITGTITGFTLANGGTGTPEQDPTATSIDDIDPKVCNAIHNINACTPEELEELGIGPYGTWPKDNPPTDDMTDTPPLHGDPGPGQVSDPSVFVDNPDTGGGAVGVHDPSGQGTWPKDNPPTDDMTDTPPTFDPAPNTIDDGQGNMPVANPEGPPPIEPTPTDDVDDLGEEVVRVTLGLADPQDSLLATGTEVKVIGEVVSEGIFSVDGRILEVNGERVQVMDYGDAAALEAEANRISPDGSSVGTTMVMWVGSPHFFRTETAIVLYVGESPTVIEALPKVMGPQFAGR